MWWTGKISEELKFCWLLTQVVPINQKTIWVGLLVLETFVSLMEKIILAWKIHFIVVNVKAANHIYMCTVLSNTENIVVISEVKIWFALFILHFHFQLRSSMLTSFYTLSRENILIWRPWYFHLTRPKTLKCFLWGGVSFLYSASSKKW